MGNFANGYGTRVGFPLHAFLYVYICINEYADATLHVPTFGVVLLMCSISAMAYD